MDTVETAAAVTRRRFLLVAAAAAATATATLAGCGADPNYGGPETPPDSVPGARWSDSGPTTKPAAETVGAPQALRGTGSRRAPGDPDVARAALGGFGADFLRQARTLDPSTANLAISPYSLFTVLAMARAGAKADTAAQIDTALRSKGIAAQGAVISAVDAGIAEAISASQSAAAGQSDAGKPMVVEAANQAWVQHGFEVHQEYLDLLAVQYGLEAMAADFAAAPEQMRAAINTWVAGRTRQLIPTLFPEDSIDSSTLLVLVNALYLKGGWEFPFSPAPAAGFFTGSSSVSAPMMAGIKEFRGAQGRGWTSASLPYLGTKARMTILVPDRDSFAPTMASLNADLIKAASQSDAAISLTMPEFSLEAAVDATAVARELGIVDLFSSDAADLSGIAGRPGDLCATALVHRAVVKVDQYGTEAAAATGMAFAASGTAGPIVRLTVDRPFLFWISETRTEAPLFLGIVTDPTA